MRATRLVEAAFRGTVRLAFLVWDFNMTTDLRLSISGTLFRQAVRMIFLSVEAGSSAVQIATPTSSLAVGQRTSFLPLTMASRRPYHAPPGRVLERTVTRCTRAPILMADCTMSSSSIIQRHSRLRRQSRKSDKATFFLLGEARPR